MSDAFRDLLRKVGSGPHTSEHLTRSEAEAATRMMLLQEATPAQIGAFMIAHRIKRPTGEELAGMLDAYDALGAKIPPIEAAYPVTVLCSPYDGRSRTAPLTVLTALVLATAGVPVLLHGGRRMPTKAGLTLIELWDSLGIQWRSRTIEQLHQVLQATGVGFIYLPDHFPLAEALIPYREEIGKRPPFSTLELMWSPYRGLQHRFCGFVHPPTENMFRDAFARCGVADFTTVKGLEGSCDLPCDRTAILGLHQASGFERLHLVPREFGFANKEIPLLPTADWAIAAQETLQGQPTILSQPLIWNSGFYLWRCGAVASLTQGFEWARKILHTGQADQTRLTLSAKLAQWD